ncbi:MAG: PRC-barrel domain-containing protein [Chloroflexota bacterium]
MRKFPILVSLFLVLAMVLAACGADQGADGNANVSDLNTNTGLNGNDNFNTNGDLNGNANLNTNGDLNGNDNFNTNGDLNGNANLNTNDVLNGNANLNTNGDLNGNANLNTNDGLNGNGNFNTNGSLNDNGAQGTPGAGGVLPSTGSVSPDLMNNLMDYEVYDQSGQQVGDVNDVILDLSGQRVAYIVVGLGGVLGLGERDVPVPCEAFQFRTTTGNGSDTLPDNALVLMFDTAQLQNAPEIDLGTFGDQNLIPDGWESDFESFWQGMTFGGGSMNGNTNANTNGSLGNDNTNGGANTNSAGNTNSANTNSGLGGSNTNAAANSNANTNGGPGNDNINGGTQGGVAATQPVTGTQGGSAVAAGGLNGAVLASQFIGADIYDGAGDQVGSIDNIIIDPATCQVRYVLLDADAADGGSRMVPVPVSAFSYDPTNDYFILVVDRQTLDAAPAFSDASAFPDFTQSGWDADYRFYWEPYLPSGTY